MWNKLAAIKQFFGESGGGGGSGRDDLFIKIQLGLVHGTTYVLFIRRSHEGNFLILHACTLANRNHRGTRTHEPIYTPHWRITLCTTDKGTIASEAFYSVTSVTHTFPHAERAFFFLFVVIKLWQYTDIFLATMNNTPSSRPHGKSTWASVNTASYLTGKMRCCEAYERACELMRVFSLWWQAHSTIGVDALIYVVKGKRVRGGGVRWLKSLSAQLYCLECRVCHHSNRKEIFFFLNHSSFPSSLSDVQNFTQMHTYSISFSFFFFVLMLRKPERTVSPLTRVLMALICGKQLWCICLFF